MKIKNKWFGTCTSCGHDKEAHPNPWCDTFNEDTEEFIYKGGEGIGVIFLGLILFDVYRKNPEVFEEFFDRLKNKYE